MNPAYEDILYRHFGTCPEGTVRCREEASRIIVSLAGSLDLEWSYRLRGFLVELVEEAGQPYTVEVDLANVLYVSSTGVGAMVDALVAAKRKNLVFRVYGFQPKVRAVFKLLGLMPFFEDSEGEAAPDGR